MAPDRGAVVLEPSGSSRRRQAHETLIHRVHAECTVGARTPLDGFLAADDVAEAPRVMFSSPRPRPTSGWTRSPPLRLTTSDTGITWVVALDRVMAPPH